jgi:hypothetical protein
LPAKLTRRLQELVSVALDRLTNRPPALRRALLQEAGRVAVAALQLLELRLDDPGLDERLALHRRRALAPCALDRARGDIALLW